MIRVTLAALFICALSTRAAADTKVEIWDTKLSTTVVTLQSVSDAVVSYFDADRRYQTLSRDGVVRLKIIKDRAPDGPQTAQTRNNDRPENAPFGNQIVLPNGMIVMQVMNPLGQIQMVPVGGPGLAGGFRPGQPGQAAQPAQPADGKPAEAKKPETSFAGPGWLWLIDGQKVRATFKGPGADETLLFDSPRLGWISVKVDKVSRFLPDTKKALDRPDGQDVLLLANGDSVVGFIETLDAKSVTFKPQAADVAITLLAETLAGFSLANPMAGIAQGQALITLANGEVLGATSMRIAQDKAVFEPTLVTRLPRPAPQAEATPASAEQVAKQAAERIAKQAAEKAGKDIEPQPAIEPVAQVHDPAAAPGQPTEIAAPDPTRPVEVQLADALTIDLAGPAGRLVSLIDLPRQVTGGGEFLGLPLTPVSRADGLLLQAPVTVQFDLPAGTSRLCFVGTAWSPADAAAQAQKWTGFTARLRTPGQVTDDWSHVYSAGAAARAVVEAGPGKTELSLDDGPSGPVLDRLLLTDAFVLVK